jgi:hypothetical protein
MDQYIDISCKMQRDTKVSMKWCDLVQFQQLCSGCGNNEKRKRSKYQQQKDRQDSAESKREI